MDIFGDLDAVGGGGLTDHGVYNAGDVNRGDLRHQGVLGVDDSSGAVGLAAADALILDGGYPDPGMQHPAFLGGDGQLEVIDLAIFKGAGGRFAVGIQPLGGNVGVFVLGGQGGGGDGFTGGDAVRSADHDNVIDEFHIAAGNGNGKGHIGFVVTTDRIFALIHIVGIANKQIGSVEAPALSGHSVQLQLIELAVFKGTGGGSGGLGLVVVYIPGAGDGKLIFLSGEAKRRNGHARHRDRQGVHIDLCVVCDLIGFCAGGDRQAECQRGNQTQNEQNTYFFHIAHSLVYFVGVHLSI